MPFLACLLIVIIVAILSVFISELHRHFPEEIEDAVMVFLSALLLVVAAFALYIMTNIR